MPSWGLDMMMSMETETLTVTLFCFHCADVKSGWKVHRGYRAKGPESSDLRVEDPTISGATAILVPLKRNSEPTNTSPVCSSSGRSQDAMTDGQRDPCRWRKAKA